MTGIFHDFNVFIQRPLLHFVWWGGPVLPTTFELVCWYPQVDCIFNGVHRNDVSVSDECDRAAYLCFRNNVANYETVRASQRQNEQNVLSGTHIRGWVRVAHPPLNLPSVTQATSWPRPAPIIKLVGLSISGMPDNKGCPFNYNNTRSLK